MNTSAAVLGLLAGTALTAPATSVARTRWRALIATPVPPAEDAGKRSFTRWLRRARGCSFLASPDREEPLRLAATWDLLAACLRAGLPVPVAIDVVARDLPMSAATALGATADLLALGADAAEAWAPALACPYTAELARAACRSARSGSALADTAAAVAEHLREGSGDRAEARAQRAGVLVTGPLGLCFLPAFLCFGVIPVVAGLASQLTVLS